MVKLAPSILSADFGRLAEEVRSAEEAGADWIHVDVMDGHFVPNITIGPLVTEVVRRATRLPVDVHLMIEKPERYLDAFAGIVTVSVGHCHPKVVEAVKRQSELLQHTTTIYLHPTIPPKAVICRAATAWPGWDARPG